MINTNHSEGRYPATGVERAERVDLGPHDGFVQPNHRLPVFQQEGRALRPRPHVVPELWRGRG